MLQTSARAIFIFLHSGRSDKFIQFIKLVDLKAKFDKRQPSFLVRILLFYDLTEG